MTSRGGDRTEPAEWLLRLVLRAYPEEFRAAHGREIVQAYRSQKREASQSGRLFRVRLLVVTVIDLIVNVPGARMEYRARSVRRRSGGEWTMDFRHALRRLARQPLFSVIVLLTLGLGVGANAALFSVVNRLLLQPLPYAEAEQLVRLSNERAGTGGTNGKVSARDVEHWRTLTSSFQGVAALDRGSFAVAGEGAPDVVDGYSVTSDFFATLGVAVARGRRFAQEEGTAGRDGVVILSHGYWAARFGSAPDVIGRTIMVNERAREIVGVLAAGFEDVLSPLAPAASIYVPLVLDPASPTDMRWLNGVGRLRAGVSVDGARAALDAQLTALRAADPSSYDDNLVVRITPLRDATVADVRAVLGFAMAAALAVLLIVCANLAGLTVARSAGRRREMAVRSALGAGRSSLIRQLLAESIVLGAGGALVGILCAALASEIIANAWGATLPRLREPLLDLRVLLFAFTAALGAAIIAGLVPALRLSATGPSRGLRETTGLGGDRARRRARRVLAFTQVAGSTALVFGAGLAITSYRALSVVDTGFDATGVTTFELRLPSSRYGDDAAVRRFYDELTASLAALPGVQSVGAVDKRPLGSRWGCNGYLTSDGPVPQTRSEWPCAESKSATPGYFDAMGIRVVEGRGIAASDRADGARVAVVSEALARAKWPGESALGKSLKWAQELGDEYPWRTVVGVVEDERHIGLERTPEPTVYMPFAQSPDARMTLAVRTGSPAGVAGPIRATVAALDDAIPLRDFQTMDDVVAARLSVPLSVSTLLGIMAVAGLCLALAGIYGVLAGSVADRVREIGLRMALGATRTSLLGSIVAEGLRIAMGALGLGLVVAYFLGRAVAGLFYGVAPFEPVAVGTTVAVVIMVAILASYLPARRAARIDPVAALRSD
jgi:predicted permease